MILYTVANICQNTVHLKWVHTFLSLHFIVIKVYQNKTKKRSIFIDMIDFYLGKKVNHRMATCAAYE